MQAKINKYADQEQEEQDMVAKGERQRSKRLGGRVGGDDMSFLFVEWSRFASSRIPSLARIKLARPPWTHFSSNAD